MPTTSVYSRNKKNKNDKTMDRIIFFWICNNCIIDWHVVRLWTGCHQNKIEFISNGIESLLFIFQNDRVSWPQPNNRKNKTIVTQTRKKKNTDCDLRSNTNGEWIVNKSQQYSRLCLTRKMRTQSFYTLYVDSLSSLRIAICLFP